MRIIACCILSVFIAFTTKAQYHPAENDTLNYRIAGFTAPENDKAYQYKFEIASGINNNDVFFNRNIITTITSDSNSAAATLPAFNTAYTWRVTYLNKKGKVTGKSKFVHFYTGIIPFADTSLFRLRVEHNDNHHKGLFIFCDRTRTLYNMNGEPLWYVPNIPGHLDNNTSVRDLKTTPFGTITFMVNDKAYEIDYNGKILWMPPNDGKVSGDTSEFYHHEFTRLKNGNYLIAGNETIKRELKTNANPSPAGRGATIQKQGDKTYYTLPMGTIIEYDTAKNIVWSWKSSEHLTDTDIFTKKTVTGELLASIHQNSIYFDEANNCIYTSFRDINRIIKIEYPSGKVLAQYGENYPGSPSISADGLFYGQHGGRVSRDGKLYLFNNNFKGRGMQTETSASAITVITGPTHSRDSAKLSWQFNCKFDDNQPMLATAGGNVLELEDGCFFVCMGIVNRNFIVTPRKKVIWIGYTEMKTNNLWILADSYRSSFINSITDVYKLSLKVN